MRLALDEDARAVLDPEARRPGRGAYACSPACLERAARRGGLARAFRARVAEAPGAQAWPRAAGRPAAAGIVDYSGS